MMMMNHTTKKAMQMLSQTNKMMFSSKILVSNLPKHWDIHEINNRFKISGPVAQVQLIKDSLGQNSGKAVVEYQYEKHASSAVQTFNNTAVGNHVCLARPMIDKQETSPRNDPSLLSRRVYLMNLPYDAHHTEIEGLVKEFAPVDKVVVPRDPKGLARGYAFVFLKKASDVSKVIDFVDGRHLRSRQIRAKSSLGGQALIEALQNERNGNKTK